MNDVNSTLYSEDDVIELIEGDLARSGLEVADLKVSPIGDTERMLCGIPPFVQGYVIPYFDLGGKPLGFYRARLFDQSIKYKQLKDTPNHVYFPRNFLSVFKTQTFRPPIILFTEGEKKAAIACKFGIPAVAFGGVDSWRNKTILLPKNTDFKTFKYNPAMFVAKIPSGTQDYTSEFAIGFDDVCGFGIRYGVTGLIVFDSDALAGVKPEVQRAAAALGHELRHRGFGALQIRQLILPNLEEADHVSLDDYLTSDRGGPGKFKELIKKNMEARSAFPRHPSPGEFIEKKLSIGSKISRREMQNLTLSVLTELDAAGRRMFAPNAGRLYYFNNATSELMRVMLNTPKKELIHDTAFGQLLYRDFGIVPAADNRLTQFLGAQFVAEEPIEKVDPYRVIARPDAGEDIIRYQISSGQYVAVRGSSKQPFTILDNGADNVLFESTVSGDGIEYEQLAEELVRQLALPLENWWDDVLSQCRLQDHGNQRRITSLLYYISPWLHRWRGTQLPVELIQGEAGSGKSTLCELRLNIIFGEDMPLRSAPSNMQDWVASITNVGAIHVTDNVHFSDPKLRQKLSDEICRLITEVDPHVEMRKFYTEADQIRLKVDPIFVFTSITKPFHQPDLLQRSMLLTLDKGANVPEGSEIRFDHAWRNSQLAKRGGRIAWVAHHLIVLHRFLAAVQTEWRDDYKAKHRLINLEQIFVVMARDVFKTEHLWIPQYLADMTNDSVASSDQTMQGLCEFVDEHIRGGNEDGLVNAKEIATWAINDDEFKTSYILTNPRSLGHFLISNKYAVSSIAGLVDEGKMSNRQTYRIMRMSRHRLQE